MTIKQNAFKIIRGTVVIGIGMLILLGTTVLLGCPEAEQMMTPVVSEPADIEMPPVTAGEVKEPEDAEPEKPREEEPVDTVPTTVIAINYYADSDLTEPIVNEVTTDSVVYTKVVFPKKVPIVIADDRNARPRIFSETESHKFQYRMKPRHGNIQDLWGGDAKPHGDTGDTFVCKYTIREDAAGGVFSVFVDNKAISGSVLSVIAPVCPHDNLPPTNAVEFTPADGQSDGEDFVGQVVGLVPIRRTADDNLLRSYAKPVPGAVVTIVSGPQSGDSVITDADGRYAFASIAGDELHLRVEKECFETKEAIVHRSLPTTLPNRIPLNFREDPQENPGVILIGQSWPEGIQEILQQTTVINDLLFVSIEIPDARGFFDSKSGVAAVDYNDPFIFHTTLHEIGHAHQHALVSLDDSGDTKDWTNTPEGQAFAEARRRDWDEFGKFFYDNQPHYASLIENGAETFAKWWSDKLRKHQGRVFEDLTLKENAPHRYRWAEEWLSK